MRQPNLPILLLADLRRAYLQQSESGAFELSVEGSYEILYLETARNKWFRSELSCFGINDARDAHAMRPLDQAFGIDRFSRVAFYTLGGQSMECRLNDVVALTPEEAIERKLMRAPRAKAS